MENCIPGSGGRLMVFTGGPCTVGPGMVVGLTLEESIRTHRDFEKGDTKQFKKACQWYQTVAQQLAGSGHCLDVFACSLDQVGIAEMHEAISCSGDQQSVLQGLLEQCPPVWRALQQLPTRSILSLAGTSSSIRKHVCGHTTNLKVASLSDSSRDPECSMTPPFQSWSSLRELYFKKPSPATLSCLAQIHLPSLQTLHLPEMMRFTGVAAALVSARMPSLKCLRLHLNMLTMDDLYELAKGQWPLLSELDISRVSWPPVDTISDPFADSNWPLLENLSACLWSCIHLFTDQHCKWPKLRALKAAHIDSLPGYVYTSLDAIDIETRSPESLMNLLDMELPSLWELQVAVYGSHGNGDMAQIVAAGKWPNLVTLKVPGHKLGLYPMAAIQRADWRQLQELALSHNHLDAKAIRALSLCTWPDLFVLKLNANNLDAVAVSQLVRGHWPVLEELELHNNKLNNEAMQWLVQGAWPCLERLNLGNNKIGKLGLQSLMLGQWPNLGDLGLWNNKLSIADAMYVYADATNCAFLRLLAVWWESYHAQVAIDRVIDMDANLSLNPYQFRFG